MTLEIDRYNLPPQVKLFVDLIHPKLKEALRSSLADPRDPEPERTR